MPLWEKSILKKLIRLAITPTGTESPWGDEEIIVSKTDLQGRITYANDVFQRVAHMTARDLIGKPHNIIRHPAMPRCVFQLLWDTLRQRKEIFAFVLNMARNGDHYWVFAHVSPSFDNEDNITGYHSNRRKPSPGQIEQIAPLYDLLLAEEAKYKGPREAVEASTKLLLQTLEDAGLTYEQFIFSL